MYGVQNDFSMLRRELSELRIGLADIMLMSTEAHLTSDAILLRALQDRVTALNDDLSQGFKRLGALTSAIQHVARGHLHERLDPDAGADVRQVAVAFNSMTAQLERALEQEKQAAAAEVRAEVQRQRADELEAARAAAEAASQAKAGFLA